jgi:hypothetical protein
VYTKIKIVRRGGQRVRGKKRGKGKITRRDEEKIEDGMV